MKETKEPIKVNATTVLLIIAMIIIGVMAYFMYSQKMKSDNEIASLQDESKKAQTTINELQGKLNNVSNNANSMNLIENAETNTVANSSNNISETFTEEQVKIAFNNYWELRISMGDEILKKLASKGVLNYNSSETKEENWYATTNIKLADYKKAMLNYVSEQEFNKTFSDYFEINNNGYLCYSTEIGGPDEYCVAKYITKKDDKTYTAKAFSITPASAEPAENEEYSFTIKNYNGHCVIDSISKI